MFKFQVIGNLGADAQVNESNGRKWVGFRVAHTERFQRSDGSLVEKTTWISCALNGDGGLLLQYLRKGTRVYVEGDGSLNVYSSPKTHQFEAGAQLNVRSIELVGAKPDAVPSRLYADTGAEVAISKVYKVPAGYPRPCQLFAQSGEVYDVDRNGWISAHEEQQPPQQ